MVDSRSRDHIAHLRLVQARLAEHESVMGAVQMSVDNLEPGDRERYEKLAVFLDDEPIPIKTLEVLWQVKIFVTFTENNLLT